jgi:hydroxymethylglutaryl-CoA lyase
VLYVLEGMGIETGIDLAKLRAASRFIAGRLGRAPVSRAYTALEAADARAGRLAAAGAAPGS